MFTSDVLIEKFHHFLHNLVATSILVIKTISRITTTSDEPSFSPESWSLDAKEKLLLALMKTFSVSMPLYIIYKQLLFNHGRYTRLKDCSCCMLTADTISLLQLYCERHLLNGSIVPRTSQDSIENQPIELIRNITHFVDFCGLHALRECFLHANPDALPLSVVDILFNIVVHLRLWLNKSVIEKQVIPIRTIVINNYMCRLSDGDLRLAGTKNITELMYETFKTYKQQHFNSYYGYKLIEHEETTVNANMLG